MGAKYVFNPLTGNFDTTDVVAFNGEVDLGTAAAPSIFFTGDPNTGIYSPGADQVAISTNGTGRLFINQNGNVAIGTSSYAGNFHVYAPSGGVTAVFSGNTSNAYDFSRLLLIGGNLSANEIYLGDGLDNDVGKITYNNDGNYLAFTTNANERLRITSDGKLGLGTSSPSNTLHVVGTGRFNVSGANYAVIASDGGDPFLYTEQAAGLKFGTNSAVRMTINSSGSVGIGTTTPNSVLDVNGLISVRASNGVLRGQIGEVAGNTSYFGLRNTALADTFANSAINQSGTGLTTINSASGQPLLFKIANNESARIDSSGRLLVGTSTARVQQGVTPKIQVEATDYDGLSLIVNGGSGDQGRAPFLLLGRSRGTALNSSTLVSSGDRLGLISWQGADGTDINSAAASIACEVDGTPGADDMPGRLVFSTTADGASIPTERVRITSTGATLIGSTNVSDGERLKVESSGAGNSAAYFVYASSDDRPVVMSYHAGSTGATSRKHYEFRNSAGAEVGSIAATGTATSYNTSSDYRLKENIVALSGAIDRVNQLQVHRFNFISDPDTTVDGFIAHEAQAVVPECVTGEKDAVDENGNPVYQGIDQSKLVPLLTAALQEALAKIETLEQRLNDAGIA